jgi:hypothetical protein
MCENMDCFAEHPKVNPLRMSKTINDNNSNPTHSLVII